jgi:hypothetical protein
MMAIDWFDWELILARCSEEGKLQEDLGRRKKRNLGSPCSI